MPDKINKPPALLGDNPTEMPAEPPVASPDVSDKIVRLLCNIQDRASIVGACLNKLNIDPADVDAAIDAAKTKLTRAADYHRDHELGKALTRLNECYQRAVGVQDTKTAISAQREINKLLDLYPAYQSPDGATESDPDGKGDRAAEAERSREIEITELSDLVGAIEAYIEPLKLSDDVNDTDSDLIRLAAEEVKRLRRQRKRKKKTGTTKVTKTTKGKKIKSQKSKIKNKEGAKDGKKKSSR